LKNEERAGNLTKGATNRVVKAREKAYKAGKEAGRKDASSLPTGVPVDLKEATAVSADPKLRGKASTMAALSAVQRSTASLGKFDKMREGEPERKKTMTKTKKRKYESSTDRKVLSSEGDKSLKILNSVMNGGGAAKEKAIRKGQLAKGETAYDYDYDDGLGASSFRKKKVRTHTMLHWWNLRFDFKGESACCGRSQVCLVFRSLTNTGSRRGWQDEENDKEESEINVLFLVACRNTVESDTR
jgi:hypothetical protein